MRLKCYSLFTGIGSPETSLDNLNVKIELLGYSEIDKYAIKSYTAIHGYDESLNLGDVQKINEKESEKDVDLITYGFPCQDISVAGNGKGLFEIDKNGVEVKTRSGLVFDAIRIINEVQPKVAVCENVKNLTSKRYKVEFETILKSLEECGYNNYWKVINAKNHQIPQNRERVIIVSIRKDLDNGLFEFPKDKPLKIKLGDILEESVDIKYFLKAKQLKALFVGNYDKAKRLNNLSGIYETLTTMQGGRQEPKIAFNVNPSGRGQNGNVYQGDICPTITTNKGEGIKILCRSHGFNKGGEKTICPAITTSSFEQNNFVKIESGIPIKEATKVGYKLADHGDYVNIQFPNSKTRRGRVGNKIANAVVIKCIDSKTNEMIKSYIFEDGQGIGIIYQNDVCYYIRKLTPLECWRLMGFSDEAFYKAQAVCSNSQLYKQAGNSIVVNVLEDVFEEVFKVVDFSQRSKNE